MTDIIEIAKKAGASELFSLMEGEISLIGNDSVKEFASLLREEFIKELGEPIAYVNSEGWALTWMKYNTDYTPLYALQKKR